MYDLARNQASVRPDRSLFLYLVSIPNHDMAVRACLIVKSRALEHADHKHFTFSVSHQVSNKSLSHHQNGPFVGTWDVRPR
jgi:hypothetical protein